MMRLIKIATFFLFFLSFLFFYLHRKDALADWINDSTPPIITLEVTCGTSHTALVNGQCSEDRIGIRITCQDTGTPVTNCNSSKYSVVPPTSSCPSTWSGYSSSEIPHSLPEPSTTDYQYYTNDGQTKKVCATSKDYGGNASVTNSQAEFVSSWFKLKDASFYNRGASLRTNIIPVNPTVFDSDDTTENRLIIGQDGVILYPTPSSDIYLGAGGATLSSRNWFNKPYTLSPNLNVASFIEYVKARKEYQSISILSEILTPNRIYILNNPLPNPPINIGNGDLNNTPYVLIVQGDIRINQNNKFNPSEPQPKKIMIISTNKIIFSPNTKEAQGIFIANEIDTGTTTDDPDGLKINGNLIALSTPLTNNRGRSNNSQPSLFIKFDPVFYIDLLSLLSISKYEWKQSQ